MSDTNQLVMTSDGCLITASELKAYEAKIKEVNPAPKSDQIEVIEQTPKTK